MSSDERITFFFTDIEHSTRLAQQLRADYAPLLEKHRQVIRKALTDEGGREIDTAGDGFFITFPQPVQAVRAAASIQREFHQLTWAQEVGLKVRVGIHTGAALRTPSGFTGVEVHYASRICNAAHGGQVFVSQSASDELGGDLNNGLSLLGLGTYVLRDFDRPMEISQLVITGTPRHFPKPRIEPMVKRIAVRPFANLSNDEEQRYFCEGIAEDIIHALDKVQGLRVVSRSSTFAFKDENLDARGFGQRLEASAVLEGSVRKDNGQLRISVELVDTESGVNIWSSQFDSETEKVFQVQDKIAHDIAEALECTLLPQTQPVQDNQTKSVEAYDYYLRGRRFYHQFSEQGMELALQMFSKASEADENYALAYAGISDCHAFLCQHAKATDENLKMADQTSLKAIELAPLLADVYASRGVALSLMGRFDEAEKAFTFAIEGDPHLFLGWFLYGRMCFSMGRLEKAARLFEKANEVRPEDYQSILLAGQVYCDLGSEELARTFRLKGIEIARKHLELNPGDTRALYLAANALAYLGEREKSTAWLRRALTLEPNDSMLLYNAACIYSLLEMEAEALNCLERSYERGLTLRGWYEHDSNLDFLRDHPRFHALMARLQDS